MAKDRAETPVEESNDLSPITIKAEDADAEDQDAGGEDADDSGGEGRAAAPATSDSRVPGRREAGQAGIPRPSKVARGNAFREVQTKLTENEKIIAELRQQMAEINGRYQGLAAARPASAAADPVATEVNGINQQLNQLVQMSLAEGLDEKARNNLAVQYQTLTDKKNEIIRKAEMGQMYEKLKSEMMGQREDSTTFAAKTMVSSEFPVLDQNEGARAAAQAYYYYLVGTKGQGQESMGLLREACAKVYADMRLGPLPGRSPQERAAYGSIRGAGGPAEGSGDDVTLSSGDLKVMNGSGVSPAQVAAAMRQMRQER